MSVPHMTRRTAILLILMLYPIFIGLLVSISIMLLFLIVNLSPAILTITSIITVALNFAILGGSTYKLFIWYSSLEP